MNNASMTAEKGGSYLDMIRSIPPHLPALEFGNSVCTYGALADLAERIRRERGLLRPSSSARKLLVIRDNPAAQETNGILHSLALFLAYSGTEEIPVIVPADARISPELLSVTIPPESCMAVMTSGTTGASRLLFRTFESWYDFFPVQNEIFSMGRECRIFMQGSLSFTGNFNLYLAQLSGGGTILAEEIFDPRLWLRRIEEGNANAIYLIPTKLQALREAYLRAGVRNRSVRIIISGSQSLGRREAEELKEVFPQAEIILYYGASELNYITYVREEEMSPDQTLIGRPFPGVQVRISDGRILVTTKSGVIGTPRDAFVGDYGHCDTQGRFYFDGRRDDICNIGGRKISSYRVEQAFLELDSVAEAAVKPIDIHGRSRLAAWLVQKPGMPKTKAQLRAALSEKLPAAEIPKYIYFISALPKTESGKIRKTQLWVPEGHRKTAD